MSNVVLDASALLALLNGEPGAPLVATALSQGASIGTVNLAEVAAKLAEVGIAERAMRQAIGSLGLDIHDFDAELAYISGMLRATTRQLGLSLGDRACLALGRRLGVPVVTADRTWLGLGFDVQVIR